MQGIFKNYRTAEVKIVLKKWTFINNGVVRVLPTFKLIYRLIGFPVKV